eukprot:TRINITY_DN60_c0_g1_i3.p1 TRINITY_DN60_c0_g1~~TRINITY_DN60_c0_g1_i3.p1  ORF type:complete len:389 (+),score=156.29 TRINITY_DN60_c0_g1_i3:105-1271(+)
MFVARRQFRRFSATALSLCMLPMHRGRAETCAADGPPAPEAVERTFSLSGGIWETQDPFVFCAYHNDVYPGGDPKTGGVSDKAQLRGRHIGSDFSGKDGWSMYHGDDVPGFPQHPHYGFETISIVKEGLVDHSDSLGCAGRFGNGDVQWMTAGDGVQHCEMFPLLNPKSNPLNFIQLWLNLPNKSKRVPPHYAMLWNEDLQTLAEKQHGHTGVMTVADPDVIESKGAALSPPPNSWAADPNNHVKIERVELAPGQEYKVAAIGADVEQKHDITRSLYFITGNDITLNGKAYTGSRKGFELNAQANAVVKAGTKPALLLLLQGRKINEPTFHQGPFFGTNREDLSEAMSRYRRTQYGGWPWPRDDMVHGLTEGRFSTYSDGTREDRPVA